MRRLAFLCLPFGALALPAAALAVGTAAGDGTLVVQNGGAPSKVAVVTLVIDGTVIGHVASGSPGTNDTVVVDDANNTGNVVASAGTGAYLTKTSTSDSTGLGTKWKFAGSDFRFRAADGVYKVTIYGSGVDLFAVGKGQVVIQGQSDTTIPDGRYSLNGDDFHSLPAQATDWLKITTSG
jgi:hypothetical protein